jgi:uncharacterized protein YcnI
MSVAAGIAALAVVLAASPALAHEQIDPKTIPSGTPAYLALSVANETKADLTKIVLTAPKGVPVGGSTRSPAGWTAQTTETSITWTGGKVAPDTFETFGFETDGAPQPGTFTFTVALTAGSSTENASVPVTVQAAGATATTVAGTTATSGATTTITPATSTPTAVPASLTDSVDSAKSRSAAALVLGAIAVALGLLAILLTLSRRRGASPAPGAPQDF